MEDDLLFSDHFKLLNYIYEHKNKYNSSRRTQVEMSYDLYMCRAKLNILISDLRRYGYLKPKGKHKSDYQLTDKAIKMIEHMRSI